MHTNAHTNMLTHLHKYIHSHAHTHIHTNTDLYIHVQKYTHTHTRKEEDTEAGYIYLLVSKPASLRNTWSLPFPVTGPYLKSVIVLLSLGYLQAVEALTYPHCPCLYLFPPFSSNPPSLSLSFHVVGMTPCSCSL